MEFLKSIYHTIVSYLPNLLSAVIVLIVGYIAYRILYKIIKKAFERGRMDVTLKNFILPAIRIVMLVVLALVALSTAGVPTASLLAVFGAVGLAVSLAVKDSLANLAGGVLLLISKPFVVGDVVEVEGVTGTVKSISILYTYINTFDNRLILIPNGQVSSEKILNNSAEANRRLDLVFDISYSDDMEKAKSLIREIVMAHPLALKEPEPLIRTGELADNSVRILCNVWVETENYLVLKLDIIEAVKNSFDQNDIHIPFPQLEVTVKHQQEQQ